MAISKEERRKLMPFTSAIVDEIRAEFGEPAGIWSDEGPSAAWPGPKPEFIEVKPERSKW